MQSPLLTASCLALFQLVPAFGAADAEVSLAWRHFAAKSQAALVEANRAVTVLAPAHESAASLDFSRFFGPVGDRGLEYSDTLRALDGRRVRISGYMVRESTRAPGVFMLTARPVVIEKSGYCFHEDLPPATVHVVTAAASASQLPYRPGRLELVGTLELGPRPEPDGRNSIVRLVLDAPTLDALAGASFSPSSQRP